jgi:glutamyl-tRNA reductase
MTTDAVEVIETVDDGTSDRPVESNQPERVENAIVAISEDAERIKRREVEKAISKSEAYGDLTDGQREIVETMAEAIVDHIFAVPTATLREADERETVDTALRLFDSRPEPNERRSAFAEVTDGD